MENEIWVGTFREVVAYNTCSVSAERSAVSLMVFSLWVTRPFSLAALSIFSFISILVNLMIMCLGFALLEEYLCGGLELSIVLPY